MMNIDKDLIQLVSEGKMKSGNNYGTGMIVVDPATGKILVARRTDTKNMCTPGGKVEIGETVLQGAVRETKEEAGIDVHSCYLYSYEMHTAENGKNWVSFMFITNDWSGEIKNQVAEVEPWAWVDVDTALSMDLFPPTEKSIVRALECGVLKLTHFDNETEKCVDEYKYIPFVNVPTSPFHDTCPCAYSRSGEEYLFGV